MSENGNGNGHLSAGDYLIEAIADAVARRLKDWDAKTQRLMTIEDAARYLGMSDRALQHKADLGEVPVVRIDAKLRFDRRELDRMIDRAPRKGV